MLVQESQYWNEAKLSLTLASAFLWSVIFTFQVVTH